MDAVERNLLRTLHEPVVLSGCDHQIEAFVLEVFQVLGLQTCPIEGCGVVFENQGVTANLVNLPRDVLKEGIQHLIDPIHRKVFTNIHRLACEHFLDQLSIEHRGEDKSCPLCGRVSAETTQEADIQARINTFMEQRLNYSLTENERKAKEHLATKQFQVAFAAFQSQVDAREQKLSLLKQHQNAIAHNQKIRLLILSIAVLWVAYYFFF